MASASFLSSPTARTRTTRGSSPAESERIFYSTQNSALPLGRSVTFSVAYDRVVPVSAIRLIEGNHFHGAELDGGWLTSIQPELRIDGRWVSARPATVVNPPDPAKPFQFIEWVLASTVQASGVRLIGVVGGARRFRERGGAGYARAGAGLPPGHGPLI